MCNCRKNILTQSKAYHSQIFDWCHCNVHFLTMIELNSSCNQFELYEQNKFNQFIGQIPLYLYFFNSTILQSFLCEVFLYYG